MPKLSLKPITVGKTKFLPVEQAARLAGVSRHHVGTLVRKDELRGFKAGRGTRSPLYVSEDDILKLKRNLDRKRVKNGTASKKHTKAHLEAVALAMKAFNALPKNKQKQLSPEFTKLAETSNELLPDCSYTIK